MSEPQTESGRALLRDLAWTEDVLRTEDAYLPAILAIEQEAANKAGHRTNDPHDCFTMRCHDLASDLEAAREAASKAVAEAVLAVESMDIDQHGGLGLLTRRDRVVFARARRVAAARVAPIASERER